MVSALLLAVALGAPGLQAQGGGQPPRVVLTNLEHHAVFYVVTDAAIAFSVPESQSGEAEKSCGER